MKVFYRSIIEDLDEAVRSARGAQRTIREIVLTSSEWAQLAQEMPATPSLTPDEGVYYEDVLVRRGSP